MREAAPFVGRLVVGDHAAHLHRPTIWRRYGPPCRSRACDNERGAEEKAYGKLATHPPEDPGERSPVGT